MFKDIKTEAPESGEHFFVDTNVWYWMTYVSSKSFIADKPLGYQTKYYPDFIEKVMNGDASLYYSPLTLVELTNLIERSEWKIHERYQNGSVKLKDFRKIEACREGVIAEVKMAWATIQSMAAPIELKVDQNLPNAFIDIISSYKIDGYDALFYQAMKESDISNIITDDKDFRNINRDLIDVYTCYK